MTVLLVPLVSGIAHIGNHMHHQPCQTVPTAILPCLFPVKYFPNRYPYTITCPHPCFEVPSVGPLQIHTHQPPLIATLAILLWSQLSLIAPSGQKGNYVL